MTNPTNALAQIQRDRKPRWWNLFLALIAALIFALVLAILAPFLIPSPSAADLSNGTFCIRSASDTDAEIKGMAGNCKPEAAAPVEVPDIEVSRLASSIIPIVEEPGLADVWLLINAQPDRYVSYWVDGRYIFNSSTSNGRGAAPITVRANYMEGIYPTVEACYAPDLNTQSRKNCTSLDVAGLFA